jgi:serine phosphatase RsbU (regulator of sigma subunit)
MSIMEAQIAAAKISKYASSESGDTLEMIERPGGGLSFVLSDGQLSGKSAKVISNAVCRKAISLLAEGVRDGAAARAASDYLFTYRAGKVLATLNILSIDLTSQTLVITRNNPAPVVLLREREISLLDAPVDAVGTRRGIRPAIQEIPLAPHLAAIVFTDGLMYAGERRGIHLDLPALIAELAAGGDPQPRQWADWLLERALQLEEGRPADDITILVAAILPNCSDIARRLSVSMPL